MHAKPKPRFGYLLRLGLESIGVHYVSIDLLRRAKKEQTTEREYWALWRLLHDLVLVVLADYKINKEEMELLNDAETLKSALVDADLHTIQMELVRFYLYEWGFVCTTLYNKTLRPSSQVLLIAIAWLLAFSKFFEKQHRYIIERCTGSKQLYWPPFPNNVKISFDSARLAAEQVWSTPHESCDPTLPLQGQIHQLHSAFGRLQGHCSELEAYARYHDRLLKRLARLQDVSKECQDECIPAHVLDLMAGPPERLRQQVQVLAQSVQMMEHEALFYKWINGLVRTLAETSRTPDVHTTSNTVLDRMPAHLRTAMQQVHVLFQAHAETMHQIEQRYKEEYHTWQSRQPSRLPVQQMEANVAAFRHEIQTNELLAPHQLFLCSPQSLDSLSTSDVHASATQVYAATKDNVARLQSQLGSVMTEITQEYCHVQLR